MRSEIMLRIRNAEVLDKLQEMYNKTKFKSINEFLNYLLEESVFGSSTKEINNSLNNIKSYVMAIWEKIQDIDDNIERQYLS